MQKNNMMKQFSGFAKMVLKEMMEKRGYIDIPDEMDTEAIAQYEEIIARNAADLVLLTLLNVEHIDLDRLTFAELIEKIPDLTEERKRELDFWRNK